MDPVTGYWSSIWPACWVERIDPVTLATLERSPDLSGGPVWPGGVAMHVNGDLYVVFGNANQALCGFSIGTSDLEPRWARTQDHGAHMLHYPETGELVTFDHDPERGEQVVILDISTGDELARADTGSPVQGVLFPAPGLDRDFYSVTFTTVSRIAVVS